LTKCAEFVNSGKYQPVQVQEYSSKSDSDEQQVDLAEWTWNPKPNPSVALGSKVKQLVTAGINVSKYEKTFYLLF
jgi:hypothetical protein